MNADGSPAVAPLSLRFVANTVLFCLCGYAGSFVASEAYWSAAKAGWLGSPVTRISPPDWTWAYYPRDDVAIGVHVLAAVAILVGGNYLVRRLQWPRALFWGFSVGTLFAAVILALMRYRW